MYCCSEVVLTSYYENDFIGANSNCHRLGGIISRIIMSIADKAVTIKLDYTTVII